MITEGVKLGQTWCDCQMEFLFLSKLFNVWNICIIDKELGFHKIW